MTRIFILFALLLATSSSSAFFLRSKRAPAAPEQELQLEQEEHHLLRQLGIKAADLFHEDPSFYQTRDCPEKTCMPVSFFVKEVQPDVMDGAECTNESECEGAYSCRYIDPAEDYSAGLATKDTGFVCAHHAKVANVCDLPCVQRDEATQ